ncbi:hypothetical protein DSO57_1013112 [Entomophthora muscae]|uniref:Uncharacterized protein n=1 Tax=Entomophthora muscae TaxID=34485 RepID=A0ACC2U448_9FUNG|nr:hypothetical protein DSO57_1013112 [Entomophthora muscae]
MGAGGSFSGRLDATEALLIDPELKSRIVKGLDVMEALMFDPELKSRIVKGLGGGFLDELLKSTLTPEKMFLVLRFRPCGWSLKHVPLQTTFPLRHWSHAFLGPEALAAGTGWATNSK